MGWAALLVTLLAVTPLRADPVWIFGMHDPGGEQNAVDKGKRCWILFTEEIGSNPSDNSGRNYTPWSNVGHGVIARLNNGYYPQGTLPYQSQYQNFATRCANYVAASPGCHIWIIGNECNLPSEWPGNSNGDPATGEPITVTRYIDCFTKVRAAIKAKPGHSSDQVIPTPSGTYCQAWPAQGVDAFDDYFTNILNGLPGMVDAIAIHAYSHGSDPTLIFGEQMMGGVFADIHYNFRVYRDYMTRIPSAMRSLPVYITESDQVVDGGWADINNGWVKNAYQEINNWNTTPGNQRIRALCLYRWPQYDQWYIQGKQGVIDDWRDAMSNDYRWDMILISGGPTAGSVTAESAVITWTTDVPSTSRVNYGTTTAYGTSVYDATLTTTHAVNLAGLSGGTTYHWKVTSTAPGYSAISSPDATFTTWPAAAPFSNGGFETGLLGPWRTYGAFDGVQTGPWFNGVTPHGGTYMAGSAANYGNKNGGLYQRCTVTAGKYYRLTGWAYTWQQGGVNSNNRVRFGTDLSGQIESTAGTISWMSSVSPQGSWTKVTQLVKATGPVLTVFLDVGQDPGLTWQVTCLDDVTLAELPTGTIQALKALPNNTEVALYGRVATIADGGGSGGNFYVEEQDRVSAVRVAWTAVVPLGNTVDLAGALGIAATGERQIVASTVQSASGGAVPRPLCLRLSALGGANLNFLTFGTGNGGPNNVGLLVRTFGKVTQIGSGYLKVDDGCGRQINVYTSAAASKGDYIGATGVVVLKGSGSGRYPVIVTRIASDVTKFAP